MSYKKFNADSNDLALQYLHKLRQLEKEIYNLEIEKSNAEHTVRSIEKSQDELKKQISKKTHLDKEQDQQRLLLIEINKSLQNSVEKLERSKNELEKNFNEQNKVLKELTQEKAIITEVTKHLKNTMSNLEKSEDELQKKLSTKTHSDNEREQEKMLRLEINRILLDKIADLQKSKDNLEKKSSVESMSLREAQQEKLILSELSTTEKASHEKTYKKYYLIIGMLVITITISFTGYTYYQNYMLMDVIMVPHENYNTNYVIQNLKGDTINTWISWRIAEGRPIDIEIVNRAGLNDDAIAVIKEVILSTKTVEIDDSLLHKGPKGASSSYYLGWTGAMKKAASEPTTYYVPQIFNIVDKKGTGQIVITLVTEKDPDNYSGFTKSITDDAQILKSSITIYQADAIAKEQLATILRHEFGHALGLVHSTAPEDLMAPTITTQYPYISDCDVDAIKALYNGKSSSEVVCEK
jgi:predicted Zn-dependent protease